MAKKPTDGDREPVSEKRMPLVNKVAGAVAGRAGQFASGLASGASGIASGAATTIADVVGVGLGIIDRAPKRGRYDRSVSARERESATRKRLLQAAVKVFTQKGYAETSVADIIVEAGTSRQTYYDHFQNKEAALLALQESSVRFMIPFIREAMNREQTAEAKVDSGITALLKLVEQAGPLAEISLREIAHTPAVLAYRETATQKFCELLSVTADAAFKQGLTERPTDPATIRALVGGIEAVALDYLRTGRGKQIMEAKPALVRLMLRALT